MRRTSYVLLIVAGCGSEPRPAPVQRPSAHPFQLETSTQFVGDDLTAEPEPTPSPPAPIWDRLHDRDGPIPGLAGFSLERRNDPKHCGGIAIITTHKRGKIDPDDQPLVDVLNVAFPTNLSFDPDPKNQRRREASLKRFTTFVATITKVGGASSRYYENKVATGDAAAQAAATARIAQISSRLASVVARAEMPSDVRTGDLADEKMHTFCDDLAAVAEPLQARADEANVAACSHARLAGGGWWDAVCAAGP